MLSAFALTACSDKKVDGDPARDWAGTTTTFVSEDEQQFTTFYTPSITSRPMVTWRVLPRCASVVSVR